MNKSVRKNKIEWEMHISELDHEHESAMDSVPSVDDAIKAIQEKAKLIRPNQPGKEFDEWLKKMEEIDKKYGFK